MDKRSELRSTRRDFWLVPQTVLALVVMAGAIISLLVSCRVLTATAGMDALKVHETGEPAGGGKP